MHTHPHPGGATYIPLHVVITDQTLSFFTQNTDIPKDWKVTLTTDLLWRKDTHIADHSPGANKNTQITDLKGALDKFNIIPQLFPKKVQIFIPLEVLAWVINACWVLRSKLTYIWRNMNISSFFYFLKSTSINTQYSGLWDTLEMMLFTKYLIKWKCIGRISWKFRY